MKYQFLMCCFSLLVNSFSLCYLCTFLGHIKVATCTKRSTRQVVDSLQWFMQEMDHLCPNIDDDTCADGVHMSQQEDSVQFERNTQSDNPYIAYTTQYLETIDLEVSMEDLGKNPFHCHRFLQRLIDFWIPTLVRTSTW